ncbi:MAG: hypothetical protein ACR2QT_07250 [Woeseiaceae bacterium]
MNTSIRNSRLQYLASGLLLATLALRALVPLGYMPGNILDGEFMVLCPVASAASLELLSSETTHHHGNEDETGVSVDRACPIGSSLFFDAIPTLELPQQIATQVYAVPQVFDRELFVESPDKPHPARGPPQS